MQVLNIFHVLIALALIVFVLIQRGQGATAGAAFGSGASGTVFGARGAGNFLTRSTWVLAALFCAISLTMAVMVSRMMTSAEPDLGVVSAPQPAATEQAEAAEQLNTEQITVGPEESADSDIPAFELTDDVPAVEESAGAPAVDESDVPAVGDGQDVPVPTGDEG